MLTRRTETTCMIEAVGAASGRLGQERREALRSGRLGVCSWERQTEAWRSAAATGGCVRRRRGTGDRVRETSQVLAGFALAAALPNGLGDADSSGPQINCR